MFSERECPSDTDPKIEEYMLQRLREMPLSEKLQRCFSLSSALRTLMVAGIRNRYVNADEHEVRMRIAALTLSREEMLQYFDWDPEIKGY